MAELYNWKRFWCPRSGDIRLDWRGYLSDPDSDWGKHENPNLVTLDKLTDLPCLVLLGEPGIGKSQEITDLVNHAVGRQSHSFVEINLRSCSHLASDLIQEPGFVAWMDGSDRLYLFLDSLDEGLLEARNLAVQIVDEFRKKKYRDKIDRLYLRIACRTAVFPQVLEEGLREIWGDDNTNFHELAPLRQADVEVAASKHGIEAQTFLAEIDRRKIASFAIKPITLTFLINRFKNHNGHFPDDQGLADIYLDGCRALCGEPNPSRRVGITGKLEVEQRLIVAARIAAVTIFANRFAVWTEPDNGDIPGADVLIRVLAVQSETASGNSFPVSEDVIREVLDTGLFSSRGASGQMGWAHQTYAEFLAAWYLQTHNLSLEQVLSLILNGDRVIPQLQETVAWLASMTPKVFEEVMKIDPDVLLQSDIASRQEEDKANLVDSLLRAYDEERLRYRFNKYQYLNHSNIGAQLRSYICDSGKGESSRLVAIDIARACGVSEVQQDLIDVAMSPTQYYSVRINAIIAIRDIGDDKIKEKLRSLVFCQSEHDPEDYLKGYSLEAIYPNHLTTEDLLSNISQPKSSSFGGAYSEFLAEKLVERLPLSDLPIFLRWIERQNVRRHELRYPFKQLTDSVMLKSWQNLNQPGVLEAFSRVATLKLKRYEGILSDLPSRVYTIASSDRNRDADIESFLKDYDEKRRQLIETVILSLPESDNNFSWLVKIISSQDMFWLIDHAISSKPTEIWVKLLRKALILHNLRWENVQVNDAILQACSISSRLQSEFEFDITPIELNSEKAEQIKASYLEFKNNLNPPKPKSLLTPPPKQRVLEILEKVEAGYLNLWWQVRIQMTLTPTGLPCNESESDITKLPGWVETEPETKKRILEITKNYLNTKNPENQAWMRTTNFSLSASAGYQAFYLLATQEPGFIEMIPPHVWVKWIPVILQIIASSYGERHKNDKACQAIVQNAYQKAPGEFIAKLISLMIQNNYQPSVYYEHDPYRWTNELLGQCLASKLLSKIPDKDLSAGMLEILLADVFKHHVDQAPFFDQATSIVMSFFDKPVPESGESKNKAIIAARILLIHAGNSGWLFFWSVMQKDLEFGREVLEVIASESLYTCQIEQKLKAEYLADLYIFIVDQYPDSTYSQPIKQELSGIRTQILGKLDGVRMWKNYIPQRIQVRGTQEACDALQKIIHELPTQKEKIQPLLLECEEQVRRSTWQWRTAEEFLQLVITQEPSHSDLLKEIKKVNEEPKTVINNIANSQINAPVGNSGPTNNQVTISSPAETKTISWSGWVAVLL
jgi:predicted NACHT family NTPase